MRQLSPAQKATLKSALRFDGCGGRFIIASAREPNLAALGRLGFASWSVSGTKYGHTGWHITDAGMTKAKELFPADAAALEAFQYGVEPRRKTVKIKSGSWTFEATCGVNCACTIGECPHDTPAVSNGDHGGGDAP